MCLSKVGMPEPAQRNAMNGREIYGISLYIPQFSGNFRTDNSRMS